MSGIEQLISDYINQELNDLITANIENSDGRQESEEIDNVVETAVTTVTPTTTTTATTSELSNEDDQIADSGVADETQSTQIESTTDDDSINEIIDEKPSINNVETNQESFVARTTTPVRNRELKSILALSKEAKLDTNLTHRRKTIDTTPTTTTKRDTMSPKKLLKTTNFPVTAESELDLYDNNDNEKLNNDRLSKKVGRKRKQSDDVVSSSNSGLEGAAEMRKNPGLLNLTPLKPNKDVFCWRCHRDGVNVVCETCPRAYHYKCLKQIITDTEHWPCPECVSILKAENTQTRSKAMKGMTLDHLCNLLKYAVKRMIQCDGSEPFIHPVDEKLFPEYRSYIIQPMDLTMLDKNIKNNLYGSTQAFEADAKWILHNCIIFNSYQSKLTTTAKTILKICKQEMAEIENCPSCYLNANTKKHTWFVEVCPKPHLLVWAKLKGFPYWPAKMMSFNTTGMVDVRFFGAHDKAWVSTKDCYLYSLKDPNSGKQKRNDIIECVKELEIYVENLKSIYGKVVYAPFKTPIEAGNEEKYLKSFLPTYYDVVNKNKKDEEIKEDIEKKIETIDTKSEQDSPNRNLEDTENSSPKQIPKTRIEYRYSSGNKPRWVVKPLKNVEIKKRQSSDNIGDSPKKRCDDKVINENKIETSPPTTEEQEQTGQEPETQPQRKSPPIKFKISDQLIRKLGDITKEIYHKKNKQIDQDEGHKMEIDKPIDPVEQSKEFEKEIEKTDKLDGEKSEQIDEESGEIGEKINSIVEHEEKSEETGDESEKLDLDIDENNIRNIIHSSLVKNNESSNTDNVSEKIDEKKVELKTRKRKRLENDQNESPPEKLIKLTPPIDETVKIDETTQQKDDKILINEDAVKEKETNNNNNENSAGTVVEIKNEAESEEEQDVEYMEAKRQYMSALNISEKQKLPIKPKANEIRTRSKTEEKRTKTNNDQLNKIVDNNRTSDSSCSDIESNRKLLLNENNNISKDEIYIKSLTKMQTTKHKARKSFPTPNYNKRNLKILPKPLDRSKVLSNSNIQIKSCNTTILPKLHYSKANIDVDNALQTRTNLPLPPLQPSVTITTNDRTINETQNESNNSSNLLINTSTITTNLDSSNQLDNELSVLKEILPENVTKSVNDILCQPPPKLKPKPFSLLNSSCESSVPSSAGPVTSRINSMTQTLSDCFRGLIVEVINDLGKSNNPEATISNLKLEIEELNYRHSLELSEIRRNVSIMLKDIQKCLIEERKRVINETKANCEIEATKRVEEAKSKQWCANCSKEAQFYCCWNTSYCDYVCQQKHWLKHMSKCTQVTATTTTSQNQSVNTNRSTINNQQTSNSGSSSGGSNTPRFRNVLSKPQKVYVKRSNTPYKGQSSNNHITLVESAPGNFEFIGNGSITVNGKILATTSVVEKIQNGNNVVTVSAPSSGTSVELTSANPITNNNNINTSNNNNNNNKNNNDNEDNSNNKVTVASKSPVSKSNDANSSDSEQ